ncbi:hypothetical protein Clacol_004044 [Clathrus columnatus]|uniref:DM2 domain-containing protein n=1 Tax=Clathrus columnatus TaxID=1419009 RepID=A0AAV5AD27_9AGAM|nr:hypothetical protein Clacol_004044 [Clathrus columnatus]
MAAATAVLGAMDTQAPKVAKRRKVTDRTIPSSLTESFNDSKLYCDLLEAERKLDWTMSRKKMEIQDAINKVATVHRTLRVFLSHMVEKQPWQTGGTLNMDPSSVDFTSGQNIPSWTLKVEGRILDHVSPEYQALKIPPRKFTSFLRGLVIELDRDQSMYPDSNIVEWRNPGTQPEQDGFELKRRGDVAVKARIILHLKRTPERYKLSEQLAEILDIKEDTRTGVCTALWHYIKVNGLQDKVDRKIIRLDAKLRAIVNLEQVTFQQLPELVNRCLKPSDPIVLDYYINVDPSNATGLQAYDIDIPVDDIVLKARMNAVQLATETVKQITSIDDEIGLAAQSIRNSKVKVDFLKAFADDPRSFVKTWLESQSRDLDIILGNEQGIREEDLKNSKLFSLPWADEAVSIQEGLRVTNALRAQQGTCAKSEQSTDAFQHHYPTTPLTSMGLSPGIRYIFSTMIPSLLVPPILTHALLVSFSIRLAAWYQTWKSYRSGMRRIPEFQGKWFGNLDIPFQLMNSHNKKYIGEMWIPMVKEFGTSFSIRILNDYRLCTINPLNIQRILVTDFDHYGKGKLFNDIMSSVLGRGVFNSDGDLWQFHRKAIRPFFTKDRVSDLMLYERKADLALDKMQERLDAGIPVDFQDLAGRFTLDAASEFLLGTSVNTLNAFLPFPFNHPSANRDLNGDLFTSSLSDFSTAFSRAQVIVRDRIERAPFGPLFEMKEDEVVAPMKEILSFVDPIVRNALSQRRRKVQKPEDKIVDDESTFLMHLLESTDDMKMVVDEILNILVAGRDLTASLLTSAVYFLTLHPDILARLRQEVDGVCGSSTNRLSHEILRNMKYLRAFLNETLRLVPPVPINLRESNAETSWIDDEGNQLYVPKGTRVVMNIFNMQRYEPYWGPNAHVFDPDRWLDARVQRYISNPFIFVPFNGGPRKYDRFWLQPEAQPPHTRPPPEWKDPNIEKKYGRTRMPIEQVLFRSHLTVYVDGGLWISAKETESSSPQEASL